MNCHFKKKPITLAIGYGLLSLMAGSAVAAGIEEVTVTAEKREESLQTTPIAISTLSADALQNLGISSFEGVAKASPSVSFTPYPSSTNLLILYMRGQGVSDSMQITSDGSVGLYSDGFYISRPQASTVDLADIERVEVLRGPQGTLYGRNTTGGAVNLISKKPTGEFGLTQDLSYGTRNAFRSLTTINLPKWNDISSKVTLLKTSKDGLVKNAGSGHDFGEEEQQAGRLSLRWQPRSDFTADYFLEKGNYDSTPNYYRNEVVNGSAICVPINSADCYPSAGVNGSGTFYSYGSQHGNVSRSYRPFDLQPSTSSFESHGLTLSWDVSDALTVKSLTGYRELDWHAIQDYAEAFSPSPGFAVGFTSDDLVRSHQFTQEFQFIGNAFDHQVDYVAGLFYFKEGAAHRELLDIILPYYLGSYGTPTFTHKDRDATADAKSQALFAQATWHVTDKLDLMAGARYTKDDRSASRDFAIDDTNDVTGITSPTTTSKSASQSYKRFNPAGKISYQWSDDINTYFSVTTGYKAGGFSESSPSSPDNFDQGFKPEKVLNLELGLKSMWFDRKLRTNIAVFQNKIDDLQLAFNVDAADTSVVQSYNAGKATVKGVELEMLIQPTDDLSFSIDYTYLDAKIDSIKALAGTVFDSSPSVNPASPYNVGDSIKGVIIMPYASKNTVNLGSDYTFLRFDKSSLALHLDYHFQSHFFDTATAGPDVPGNTFYQVPSAGVFNGRLTLATELPHGDRVKVSLWGKNLAHHEYPVHVIGNGNGIATQAPSTTTPNPNPVTPAGYFSSASTWAEPASFGIDVHYEY